MEEADGKDAFLATVVQECPILDVLLQIPGAVYVAICRAGFMELSRAGFRSS